LGNGLQHQIKDLEQFLSVANGFASVYSPMGHRQQKLSLQMVSIWRLMGKSALDFYI
jgi:hypothetical protein